jgi:hypothetical protein
VAWVENWMIAILIVSAVSLIVAMVIIDGMGETVIRIIVILGISAIMLGLAYAIKLLLDVFRG